MRPPPHSGAGHPPCPGRAGRAGLRPDRHRQDLCLCRPHPPAAERGPDAGPPAHRALILTPTRELAIQIQESFDAYGSHLSLRHAVIFGGVGQNPRWRPWAAAWTSWWPPPAG